jgi:hypothetical protein
MMTMLVTRKTEELASWKRHLIYGPEMMYTNKILGKHKTTERANFEVCTKGRCIQFKFSCRHAGNNQACEILQGDRSYTSAAYVNEAQCL